MSQAYTRACQDLLAIYMSETCCNHAKALGTGNAQGHSLAVYATWPTACMDLSILAALTAAQEHKLHLTGKWLSGSL